MKQIIQNIQGGGTEVVDVPVPQPAAGMVLVRNVASLVSAGTERRVVDFAARSLIGKARLRPDLVRQTINKAQREGVLNTVDAVRNRLSQPMPLGYSSAGVVVDVGAGVEGFRRGDRVACSGGNYAVHAEFVTVPVNLVALLPDHVDFESAAFGTIAAITMHGFRLAHPEVGERVAVIGLGVLGLLAVEIAQAAGCSVFGVDLDPQRVALANELGARAVVRAEAEAAAAAASDGFGFDIVLICADTTSNDPIELAAEIARDRGRVISVGAVGLAMPRKPYFTKELTFLVSRSSGPGRYDTLYEEKGIDYPIGYVRWTEGRNLESVVALMAAGRMNPTRLISHRFPIESGVDAYGLLNGTSGESFLGVLLTYPQAEAEQAELVRVELAPGSVVPQESVRVGVIGAGNFATAVLLPAMKKIPDLKLMGLVTRTGISSASAGKRFGFSYAATDPNEILHDDAINTIAIATRHKLHAGLICAAFKAGKHVFCEKPLALTREELDEVARTLQGSGRLLTVGFNRRFAPLAVAMQAFFAGADEPKVMQYRVNAGLLPLDHWLHDPTEGGGRIIGEGCHFIDFLTFMAGALPVRVHAYGAKDTGKYREDNVVIIIEYANGSLGTVTYLANGDKSFPKERVEVFSAGRIAVLDDYRTLTTTRDGRKQVRKHRLRQDKGFQAEWQAFADAIRTGAEPTIPYPELFTSSETAIAAVESLRKGIAVDIGSWQAVKI